VQDSAFQPIDSGSVAFSLRAAEFHLSQYSAVVYPRFGIGVLILPVLVAQMHLTRQPKEAADSNDLRSLFCSTSLLLPFRPPDRLTASPFLTSTLPPCLFY
jgi:hypothetical protein